MNDEAAFHAELWRLGRTGQWDAWTGCRLVFGDWLEEHGRDTESAMARAEWRVMQTRTVPQRNGEKRAWWVRLRASGGHRDPSSRGRRRVNGLKRQNDETMLGFVRRSLKLLSAGWDGSEWRYDFGWCCTRDARKYLPAIEALSKENAWKFETPRLDTDWLPGGFPSLWAPEPAIATVEQPTLWGGMT